MSKKKPSDVELVEGIERMGDDDLTREIAAMSNAKVAASIRAEYLGPG